MPWSNATTPSVQQPKNSIVDTTDIYEFAKTVDSTLIDSVAPSCVNQTGPKGPVGQETIKALLINPNKVLQTDFQPVVIFPYNGLNRTLKQITLCINANTTVIVRLIRSDTNETVGELEIPPFGQTVVIMTNFSNMPTVLSSLTLEASGNESVVSAVEIEMN